jgi:predicted Rossmann fold nucleotide-binding protein DprA/Smf involved in DNA uptake
MNAEPNPLSDDAIATVLVASYLGLPSRSDVTPLGPVGWFNLAATLHQSGKRPAYLLGTEAAGLQAELGLSPDEADAIVRLTERAGSIGFDLDQLAQRGIWVLTRGDAGYPRRLASKLGANRPPVLFGAGPRDFLASGGIAIVGSRNVDEAGSEFATIIGGQAAYSGINVISGGARGVDLLAMQGAIAADGVAVGVLTDSLERWIKDPDLRSHIHGQRLTLVTPFKPDAGFNARNAMARNKYVYALADYSVVVASDKDKGGTWSGAIENLREKNRWSVLFVRQTEDAPAGNAALIQKGGIPLRRDDLNTPDLRARLDELRDSATCAEPKPGGGQMPLFGGNPPETPDGNP